MSFPVVIPESLRDAMYAPNRSDFGPAWIADLPDRIARLADRYSLVISPPMTEPYAEMSFNYITPALMSNGKEIVLKVAYQRGVYETELAGLRLLGAEGMVGLVDADDEEFAFLLERVRPGIPLSESTDDEANTRSAASLMRRLWQPAPEVHKLRTVEDWTIGGMR